MAQSAAVSGARIVEVIQTLLEKNFGRTAAKAIDFYADTDIALTNPKEYTRILLNIFGQGTEHLLTAIITGLGERFGVKVSEGTTLDEVIGSLRPEVAQPSGGPHE
jgi:hypothetical protein